MSVPHFSVWAAHKNFAVLVFKEFLAILLRLLFQAVKRQKIIYQQSAPFHAYLAYTIHHTARVSQFVINLIGINSREWDWVNKSAQCGYSRKFSGYGHNRQLFGVDILIIGGIIIIVISVISVNRAPAIGLCRLMWWLVTVTIILIQSTSYLYQILFPQWLNYPINENWKGRWMTHFFVLMTEEKIVSVSG